MAKAREGMVMARATVWSANNIGLIQKIYAQFGIKHAILKPFKGALWK
jgi:hypothetical protein